MTDTPDKEAAPARSSSDQPPKLDHEQLARAQAETLASPRRHYGVAARLLFWMLDVFYGKARVLSKFKVLELVARVPYQAWEQTAYVAITHVHERRDFSRRIYERVLQSRAQQDNEQWHLLILNEQIANSGKPESRFMFYWLPQLIAFGFYQFSWLLFVVRPQASYRLNADFEDHAEHEYMTMVSEHPEWDTTPFNSQFTLDYGEYASFADVLRQIGHDERVHKLASETLILNARFA